MWRVAVKPGQAGMFSDPGDDHLRISNKSINREYFSFAGRLGYDRVNWKQYLLDLQQWITTR